MLWVVRMLLWLSWLLLLAQYWLEAASKKNGFWSSQSPSWPEAGRPWRQRAKFREWEALLGVIGRKWWCFQRRLNLLRCCKSVSIIRDFSKRVSKCNKHDWNPVPTRCTVVRSIQTNTVSLTLLHTLLWSWTATTLRLCPSKQSEIAWDGAIPRTTRVESVTQDSYTSAMEHLLAIHHTHYGIWSPI